MQKIDCICICGATSQETFWIKKALTPQMEWKEGSAIYRLGTCSGKKICLIQSGIGRKNLIRALCKIPFDHNIILALNIGCTGSLLPYLKISNLNIPPQISLHLKKHSKQMPPKDLLYLALLTARSFKRIKAHFLPSLTVKKTFDKKDKLALHRTAPHFGCIDMESYYFAQFFSQHKIPYLVIRSVSDTRYFKLPPFPFLSPSCWKNKKSGLIPVPMSHLPCILRFHTALYFACWTNQSFVLALIKKFQMRQT